MRSSTFILAGASAASAQVYSSITGGTQTFTITDSNSEPLYTTTVIYSNPATAYQSLTNSAGVVTGLPEGVSGGAIQTQPAVVTSQPLPDTIPAGLPTGVTYIQYNGTAGATSFQVSVGSSTTVVNGGAAGTTGGSGSSASESGSSGSSGSDSSESGSSGSSDSEASSSDSAASASASESGNAASSVKVAGAGIGLFAFIAALL